MKITFFAAMLISAALTQVNAGGVHDVSIKSIDGENTQLSAYKGKALLIVNVASECGYTPQYQDLEQLYRRYKDKGLVILGVPCNDFGGQEPGSLAEIKSFCSKNYSVTFPLTEKVKIKGDDKHPLYQTLTGKASPHPGEVGWNFTKFLVDPDGKIVGRYRSSVKPLSKELVGDIESALKAKS